MDGWLQSNSIAAYWPFKSSLGRICRSGPVIGAFAPVRQMQACSTQIRAKVPWVHRINSGETTPIRAVNPDETHMYHVLNVGPVSRFMNPEKHKLPKLNPHICTSKYLHWNIGYIDFCNVTLVERLL